ncbi:hypothetical protein INR49_001628, partial [Caranx melampygus]
IHPSSRLVTPQSCFGTLFGSPTVSSPFPSPPPHPTPTPPTPLSVHPRVYPLITDLPSSLQSSSVPHRSSGERSSPFLTSLL